MMRGKIYSRHLAKLCSVEPENFLYMDHIKLPLSNAQCKNLTLWAYFSSNLKSQGNINLKPELSGNNFTWHLIMLLRLLNAVPYRMSTISVFTQCSQVLGSKEDKLARCLLTIPLMLFVVEK